MKQTFLIAILATGLSACSPVNVTSPTVKIYKADGSVSCNSSSGMALDEMQEQLLNAKIKVSASSCGHDGLIRATVCGIETGNVNVYEINANALAKATALGFQTVDSLPEFRSTACSAN